MNRKHPEVSVDQLVQMVKTGEDIKDLLNKVRSAELKTLLDGTEERIKEEEADTRQSRKDFSLKAGPLLTVKKTILTLRDKPVTLDRDQVERVLEEINGL